MILGMRLVGLALVAGDGLEGGALVGDHVRRHVVAPQVLRPGEGDVHGDVVRQLGAAAGHLDEHGVDAASALDVHVAVEDVAVGRLDAHDVAELDLLLERDLQLLELRRPLGDGICALGDDEVDQRCRPRP